MNHVSSIDNTIPIESIISPSSTNSSSSALPTDTKLVPINDIETQFEPESTVAVWIDEQIKQECQRLTNLGQKVLPLRVFNYGLLTERPEKEEKATKKNKKSNTNIAKGRIITNRIEFGTNYNFDQIKQILTSPSIPCDSKPGYRYCHIILLTNTSPVALVFGYIWNNTLYNDNTLNRWLFINKLGKESLHIVNEYQDIKEKINHQNSIIEDEEEEEENDEDKNDKNTNK